MQAYAPLVLYTSLVIILPVSVVVLSSMLGHKRDTDVKGSPYECGVPIQMGARERFSVHFYLVAILFILFDLETVFLIPWALVYRSMGTAALIEMGVFLTILGLALVYVWRRRGLEWD